MRQIFDAALLNVFSVPLKPLDAAAFLRGVRQRFRIRRFVARAQGPQGLFRQDMPDTLSLVALDDDDREARFALQRPAPLASVCGAHKM